MTKYLQFKEKFGERIKEIEFKDVFLHSPEILLQCLDDLKNLRKIKIFACRLKYPTVYPVYPSKDISLNITSLFIGNDCADDLVGYILSLTPNLKSLNVASKYPILKYLINPNLTKSLRELRFNGYIFDNFNYFMHLNLETFHFVSENFKNEINSIEGFLTRQTNLKDLSFDCGSNLIQWSTENIEIFWKLKHLKLSQSNATLFNCLTETIAMESLTIESFDDDINDDKIIDKLKYLKNLKILKISIACYQKGDKDVTNFIENKLIQGVFKHLLNLRELCLIDCNVVSVYLCFNLLILIVF